MAVLPRKRNWVSLLRDESGQRTCGRQRGVYRFHPTAGGAAAAGGQCAGRNVPVFWLVYPYLLCTAGRVRCAAMRAVLRERACLCGREFAVQCQPDSDRAGIPAYLAGGTMAGAGGVVLLFLRAAAGAVSSSPAVCRQRAGGGHPPVFSAHDLRGHAGAAAGICGDAQTLGRACGVFGL